MTSPELENLVRTGKLKREPPATGEIEGLRSSRAEDASESSPSQPD